MVFWGGVDSEAEAAPTGQVRRTHEHRCRDQRMLADEALEGPKLLALLLSPLEGSGVQVQQRKGAQHHRALDRAGLFELAQGDDLTERGTDHGVGPGYRDHRQHALG